MTRQINCSKCPGGHLSPHLANETEPILRRPHDPMNDDTAMGDGTIGLEPSDVQRICHADLTSERSADFSMTIPANLKTLWDFPLRIQRRWTSHHENQSMSSSVPGLC